MAKSMTASLQVQHLTYGEEVDFTKIRKFRKELQAALGPKGIKLSYMPMILKATSLALLQFPMLNAHVSHDLTEMIYKGDHNLGVAMDTPSGLIVPVIKRVQQKSIIDIAYDLQDLQVASSAGKLTEEQLSGGTFSLSNIGSIGGTFMVPVVTSPNVAIGALGRIQMVPSYVDERGERASVDMIDRGQAKVAPLSLMTVSWSADHRVVDGATVGKFSNLWKSYIENPSLLAMNMR